MIAWCAVSVAVVVLVAVVLGYAAVWCIDMANRLAAEREGE